MKNHWNFLFCNTDDAILINILHLKVTRSLVLEKVISSNKNFLWREWKKAIIGENTRKKGLMLWCWNNVRQYFWIIGFCCYTFLLYLNEWASKVNNRTTEGSSLYAIEANMNIIFIILYIYAKARAFLLPKILIHDFPGEYKNQPRSKAKNQ